MNFECVEWLKAITSAVNSIKAAAIKNLEESKSLLHTTYLLEETLAELADSLKIQEQPKTIPNFRNPNSDECILKRNE